jgi:hypothetical protein
MVCGDLRAPNPPGRRHLPRAPPTLPAMHSSRDALFRPGWRGMPDFCGPKTCIGASLKCMVPCGRKVRVGQPNTSSRYQTDPDGPLHHPVRATNQPLSSPTQHFLESCINKSDQSFISPVLVPPDPVRASDGVAGACKLPRR